MFLFIAIFILSKAKEQLEGIGDTARRGLQDVRRSVRKLKPDALERMSLNNAIHQMIEDMSKVTNTKIYFVSYMEELEFEADEEEVIYRIIQESTTNAIRHGKATEIWSFGWDLFWAGSAIHQNILIAICWAVLLIRKKSGISYCWVRAHYPLGLVSFSVGWDLLVEAAPTPYPISLVIIAVHSPAVLRNKKKYYQEATQRFLAGQYWPSKCHSLRNR